MTHRSLIFTFTLVLIMGIPTISQATDVGGTIAADATWALADSPFTLTQGVLVNGTDAGSGHHAHQGHRRG